MYCYNLAMPPNLATSTAEHLRRFERRPRDIPGFEITERDTAILQMFAHHRFIASAQIIAVVAAMFPDTSEQQVLRRLFLLYHAGYVARPEAQVDIHQAGGESRPIT